MLLFSGIRGLLKITMMTVLVEVNLACYHAVLFVILCVFRDTAAAFVIRPEDTVVINGNTTQLNCTFSTVIARKEWRTNGRLISEDDKVLKIVPGDFEIIGEGNIYNLRIHNTTINQSGSYECSDTSDTNKKATANLFVIESYPECTVWPGTLAIAGDNVILNCTINLDKDAPGDLVWFKNGTETYRQNSTTNIRTREMERSDNDAHFDCQFQHKSLPKEKWAVVSCENKIKMDVQFAPDVSIITSEGNTVKEGHTFSVECVLNDANPKKMVNTTWLGPTGNILSEQDKLTFDNVTRHQRGNYNCVKSNEFFNGERGNATDSIEINVQYSSRVNITLSRYSNVTEGDDVTIYCHAFDGNPNPQKMTLSLGHEIVKEENDPELQHTIMDIKGSDSGIYNCTAHTVYFDNTQSSSSAEQEIVVFYSQIIDSSKLSFEAGIGDVIDMPCKANGYPTPTIKWYDGEDNVIPGDEENRKTALDTGDEESVASTLTVTVADDSYYGIYICEASNGILSTDTQTMEIRKPAITGSFPVAIVAGSSAGGTVILICILVGIICYCKNRKNDSKGKEYGGESNDGTLMRARTTNRLEPEGLSHDINPYAESTTAPMRVTSSVEKIVTNEYELMSAPVTSGHGDATHLSGTQDVPGLYAVSSKQETAGDRNKDAAEMVLYAMPDKTRKNRKAGELNYADLDLSGNQSGQRPQRITPVEKTVYADLQTTPAKMY